MFVKGRGLDRAPIKIHGFKTMVFYRYIFPKKNHGLKPYFFIGFLNSAGGRKFARNNARQALRNRQPPQRESADHGSLQLQP